LGYNRAQSAGVIKGQGVILTKTSFYLLFLIFVLLLGGAILFVTHTAGLRAPRVSRPDATVLPSPVLPSGLPADGYNSVIDKSGSVIDEPGEISPDRIIRDQVKQLLPGQIVFNPPTTMRVGATEVITVRIARTQTEHAILENLRGRGIPQVEQIKVGTLMQVRLYGDGFDVNTHSNEDQTVPENQFAEWTYDVTPLVSGDDRELVLQVSIRFELPNRQEFTDLPVLTRKIKVQVNDWWSIQQFFAANWQWFGGGIGTVFVGLAGFVGTRWFAQRDKANQSDPRPEPEFQSKVQSKPKAKRKPKAPPPTT
jgi:hypothetical protein